MTEVTPVSFHNFNLAKLGDEIKDVIAKYSGQVSLAEVIGILEIVKTELLEDHKD